jgi:tetratricopeptide (TPR) repeat protein
MRPLRLVPVIVIAVVMLLSLGGCRFWQGDPYQRGLKAFEKKDYPRARIEFKRSLAKQPTVDAYYYYALASLEVNDPESAAHALSIAESMEGKDVGPHSIDIRLKVARLMYFGGQIPETIRRCNWVLKRDPGNKEARELLAFSFAAVSQPAKAVGELDQVLTADPTNLQARVLMASIKLAEKDRQEAYQQLAQAVEQTHRSPASLVTLANFYQMTGQLDKAEPLLVEAIKANPQAMELRGALGWLYARTGQPQKAEATFQEIARLHPEDPVQRAVLSNFYLFENDWPKAFADMEAMVKSDPKNLDYKVRLAGTYYLAGRWVDSRKVVTTILEQDKDNLRGQMLSGLLEIQEGQADEALQQLNSLLHSMADSGPLHYFIGLAYQRENKLESAQLNMQQALKLDRSLLVARLWLIDYFLGIDAYDPALGVLRGAPPEQAASPLLRLRLAAIDLGLKHQGDACAEVRSVVSTNAQWIPQFYEAGFTAVLDKCVDFIRFPLEEQLKAQPESVKLLAALAHVVTVHGSKHDAVTAVQKQIDSTKGLDKSAPHLVLLAKVLTAAGDRPAAYQASKRASELQPNWPDPVLAMAQVEIADKNLEAAGKHCEELVKRWPNIPDGWLWLGSVREVLGDLPAATAAYEKAVSLNPKNALASNNLAWRLASDGGDYTRAVALAKQATALQPDRADYGDTLGWALYKAGQLRVAQQVLEDVIRRDPRNSDFLYHLARVEKDAGDSLSATSHLKRALDLNPRFSEAERSRSLLQELKAKAN